VRSDQTDRIGWFGTVPNFRTRGDGSGWYVTCSPAAFRGPCEGDCERILPGHLPREAAEHFVKTFPGDSLRLSQ
jgi:hypothetical protein